MFLSVLTGLGLLATPWAATAASKPTNSPALTVHIKDYKYAPKTAKVRVGDTVAFANDDDETHTVTVTDGTFDSRELKEKARFSHTFTKAGTYNYYCKIHTQMKGTIVVETSKKGAVQ